MKRRKTITFTDKQIEYITAEVKRLGISFADVVRRIIDGYRHG